MLTPVCRDFEREAALEHFGTTLLWGMIPTTGLGGLGGFLPRFLCQANWTKEYRVEKLNGRVQSMERRTKTLERNIEEQMTRVWVLRTCQKALVTLIESLQSRITNLEEHTGNREENIKSLEQDIKSCKDDIESWEENFEMARKDILRLRLRIGSLNSDIAWLSKHPDGQGNILGSLGRNASM
jgi:predicted  nucleic acid-binding Zn-ribbon protein